jgi:hypothetical protein
VVQDRGALKINAIDSMTQFANGQPLTVEIKAGRVFNFGDFLQANTYNTVVLPSALAKRS